jgi:hypothetical protein
MTCKKREIPIGSGPVRLTIEPEPTEEELLAIIQALRLLDDDGKVNSGSHIPEDSWAQCAREQVLRQRTRAFQGRSWTISRR